MASLSSHPAEDGISVDQQAPEVKLSSLNEPQLVPAKRNEAFVHGTTASSTAESTVPVPPMHPIMGQGESQQVAPSAENEQAQLLHVPSESLSQQKQAHTAQVEVNKATNSAITSKDPVNTALLEPSYLPAAEEESNRDIPASMDSSSIYTTGLDVDSNQTETDHSDGDSAIGASLYSSTYSTSSSMYDFVQENGRTYHRFKEGKYHLPNDEVSSRF